MFLIAVTKEPTKGVLRKSGSAMVEKARQQGQKLADHSSQAAKKQGADRKCSQATTSPGSASDSLSLGRLLLAKGSTTFLNHLPAEDQEGHFTFNPQ